ncbi:MAG: cytochrome C oxidase subunit IV family protein [Opitutae bacterium]|nr:cytochrome C oxidase subunit IV family protein [Opitutae bacterium]MBT5908168.1 cytochrome C oxidase subunit IV family protein [Opitutae bacterium]MBT6851696.1 cytochrome C oxidase subunit IV family protein [Opitutae bacterium]MBT7740231.1 cytochrome C oxidase subunit IV family protein [Opitutae bacterium]
MSGHGEDPVEEESKRFFTFFNLSMALVAITGIEIVIIYVQSFESASIIGILFTTSIIKFFGVVYWFMHLKWDKLLNTILFLMGLVIALGTYFAVIYMADDTPIIENFEVAAVENAWEANTDYTIGTYLKHEDAFYKAGDTHTSKEVFNTEKWEKVEGIPHRISWKIEKADMIEINSRTPDNPFYHRHQPEEPDNVEGSVVRILAKVSTKADFCLKARSEANWTESSE